MSTSIRFFCGHCQLMMKVNSKMSGRTVICPQCLKKIDVPSNSDPQAERLYLYLKQKKTGVGTELPQSQKTQKQTPVQTNVKKEQDEIDKWIDEFWTSLPENETPQNKPSTLPTTQQKRYSSIGVNEPAEINQTGGRLLILRNDKYLLVVIIVIFLISFLSGFLIRGIWLARNPDLSGNSTDNSGKSEINIAGKLSYKNEFGIKKPDVDATIIFIPADAKTAIPISTEGLRADNGTFNPNNDNVQRIAELGGIIQRTGADGGFNFSLKSGGDYIAIMISSHVKRTNATQLPPEIINYLKTLFTKPAELINDFRVEKEEYNINKGTQIIHKTFE